MPRMNRNERNISGGSKRETIHSIMEREALFLCLQTLEPIKVNLKNAAYESNVTIPSSYLGLAVAGLTHFESQIALF